MSLRGLINRCGQYQFHKFCQSISLLCILLTVSSSLGICISTDFSLSTQTKEQTVRIRASLYFICQLHNYSHYCSSSHRGCKEGKKEKPSSSQDRRLLFGDPGLLRVSLWNRPQYSVPWQWEPRHFGCNLQWRLLLCVGPFTRTLWRSFFATEPF